MPTYEYVCRSCGHLFEIVQSMRDPSLTECPQCGGELRKVFAPPAISFKGSGFYANDQRKKAHAGESQEKKGSSGPDAGSDTGTDKPSRVGAEGGAPSPAEKKSETKTTETKTTGTKTTETKSRGPGGSSGSGPPE